MTPEQIKKIILYEHNKEECVCHYPSVNNPDWAIVAAEKISEEQEKVIEIEKLDFIEHHKVENNRIICLGHCCYYHDYSLSQPSGNASQSGAASVREGLLVRNSLADAGELLRHVQQDRSNVKHASPKGNEPAMGDEQRNNSPAATESVANSHSKDTSKLPENGDALASLETHVNAVSHRVTKSGCTQDVGSSEETAGEIPMCLPCKYTHTQAKDDCGCSCHKKEEQ